MRKRHSTWFDNIELAWQLPVDEIYEKNSKSSDEDVKTSTEFLNNASRGLNSQIKLSDARMRTLFIQKLCLARRTRNLFEFYVKCELYMFSKITGCFLYVTYNFRLLCTVTFLKIFGSHFEETILFFDYVWKV